MPFNINQFKSRLEFGGARPCLFEVQLVLPPGINFPDNVKAAFPESFTFLCRSASLPASSVSNIEIPFRGRKVYCAGNRVFEPWSVVVINDENFVVRKAFEFWLGSINGHESNTKNNGVDSSPNSYQTEAIVKQFPQSQLDPFGPKNYMRGKYENLIPKKTDVDRRFYRRQSGSPVQEKITPITTYRFVNIFPTDMAAIELDWNNTDSIEEFSVTFKYDYWNIGPNE